MTPTGPLPLYRQIEASLQAKIDSGAWPAGHRVPSENELVKLMGVSRMTARRALVALSDAGCLQRVRGVGTFVCATPVQAEVMELRNIADEIRGRGHQHASDVVRLERTAAPAWLAAELGLVARASMFHSRLVHHENGVPVQLEDRYVNPAVVPDYLSMDFTAHTPNAYLMQVAPLARVEHTVEAIIADAETQTLLRIGAREPCLRLRRRTWSGAQVASFALLTHPGSRFRLHATFDYLNA